MTPSQEQALFRKIAMHEAAMERLHADHQQLMRDARAGAFGSASDSTIGDALKMVADSVRLNAEVVKNLRKLGTNQGAVYAEQVPGDREPFTLTKDVTISAGSAGGMSASESTPSSGPFECTMIRATAKMQIPVFSDGATITTQLRFRAIRSDVVEPAASPDPAAAAQPSYTPNLTYVGVFDFLWEYQPGSSTKRRMNAPLPSSFLDHERWFYLSCGDFFATSDTITWTVTPLLATYAWFGGVQPGDVTDVARAVTVTWGFHGTLYKQAPNYAP